MKIFAAFSLLLVCMGIHARPLAGEPNLINFVANLNSQSSVKQMESLAPYSHKTIPLLIAELHTVAEMQLSPTNLKLHKKCSHIIGCIRALRYLTGKNPTASTNYHFKENEGNRRQFLYKTGNLQMPFFTTWMSHDVIYIAPLDAQLKIIDAWKTWWKKHAAKYQFLSQKSLDDWYF